MSDIRGFTTLSQWIDPQQVVRLLNRYLGTMADVVREYHGTVDEFIGDSVLALFGAPVGAEDDAQRAVACAIEMQRAMEGVNRLNREDGLPLLQMGIAVHHGRGHRGQHRVADPCQVRGPWRASRRRSRPCATCASSCADTAARPSREACTPRSWSRGGEEADLHTLRFTAMAPQVETFLKLVVAGDGPGSAW